MLTQVNGELPASIAEPSADAPAVMTEMLSRIDPQRIDSPLSPFRADDRLGDLRCGSQAASSTE